MKLFSQYRGLRKEIYVLFVSKIVTCMGAMVWAMMTSILSINLGMSASEITTWMVVYSIVTMPLVLLGGKLADKFDKKKIIIYSDIIEAVIYVLCAILPFTKTTMIVVLAASAIENISNASYSTLLMDLTTSADRKRANSLLYLGTNIGMVLAPTISGFLVNKYVNIIFLINGITTLLALAFEAIALKDVSAIVDDSNKYEAPRENASIIQVFKDNKLVIIFILLFSIEGLIYRQYNFMMPLDLNATFLERGSEYYGFMSSINCITVVAFTSLMTKLFNKRSDITQFVVGETLFGVGYILYVIFKSNIWIDFFSMFIFTIGEILCTISCDVIISKRVPITHRGRVFSIWNVAGTIIYSICQIPISNIYETKGSNVAWTIIIVITLLVSVMFLLFKKKDKKTYPDLYNPNYTFVDESDC